jgi:hypothetical protein
MIIAVIENVPRVAAVIANYMTVNIQMIKNQ